MKNILITFTTCILYYSCSSYAFYVDSDPTGADLNIINNNKEIVYTGKTPIKVDSKNIPKGEYLIILSKIGYEDETVLKGNSENLRLKKMNLGKRNLKKSYDPQS